MSAFPEPNPKQNNLGSQAGQAMPAANEPTAQEIRTWNKNKLLEWVQRKLPSPLEPEDAEAFLKARMNGDAFLYLAGDRATFQENGFSVGGSVQLASLAGEIIGRKSKNCPLYHGRADSQLIVSQGTANKPGLQNRLTPPLKGSVYLELLCLQT